MNGKILVFTGDGKGKTTAAIGTAIRAIGHGKKVIMIQFLKKGEYGEIKFKNDNLEVYQFGTGRFVRKVSKKDREIASNGIKFAIEIMEKRKPFLLILDEINVALSMGIVNIDDVMEIIRRRNCHIILTGRNAHPKIIEIADLVTEMKKIKHYYDTGTKAIEGIEY